MKWELIKNKYDEYENFIKNHPYSGIWHHPLWLKLQLESNRIIDGDIFILKNNAEQIILGGIISIYKINFFKYGYIQAGFLYSKFDEKVYNFFLENLNNYAKEKKLIFTQIDSITPFDSAFIDVISKYKYHLINVKLPIPTYTNIIDLNLSLEEILQQMKPKGRYNIKVAQKHGLKVKIGNLSDIESFYELLKETAKRDGFFINKKEYYYKMLEILPYAKLILIYKDNIILATGIFTFFNNQALYYYGASSNQFRNLMPTYLLQWEAIKLGKNLGCKFFDFLGIANPECKSDKLQGVTEFKTKFGGKVVRFNPSYKIVHRPLTHFMYRQTKKIKKLINF